MVEKLHVTPWTPVACNCFERRETDAGRLAAITLMFILSVAAAVANMTFALAILPNRKLRTYPNM